MKTWFFLVAKHDKTAKDDTQHNVFAWSKEECKDKGKKKTNTSKCDCSRSTRTRHEYYVVPHANEEHRTLPAYFPVPEP